MENEVLMSANAENKSEFIGIENADGRKSSSGEIFDESGEVDNSDSTLIANNNKIDSAAEEKNDKGNGGDGGQSNKASRKLRRGASLRSSRASSGARSRSRSRTYSRSRSRSHHSRSRTYSDSSDEPKAMKRRRKTSRSRSRSRCSRSNSSSSRDTYGSFRATSPTYQSPKYPCKKCDRRDFETIRELSEHEIRAHGAVIPCPHCSRDRSSVQKLVEHLNRRHGSMKLTCHYCKESFSSKIETAKQSALEEYRSHIYKECLKEKMYKHERLAGKSGAVAQRGRGRCPHGPPVKCKNFPNCPGDKCYYFHGYCRHDIKCIKKDCPFDHSNRPRTCLSCLRDLRRRSEDLETKLHVTGLRERRLIVLLVVLALLIILSFCVLIMNIFLIRTLGITSHGIRHLHIHAAQSIATGSEVNVVQFTAESIHLGNIITKTGSVFGLPEKDFSIDGSRVIIHGGSNNRSRFTLHDGYCRLEDVDQFTVKNQKRLLFSATNPVFRVDRRVKKIAAGQLITNKIRSPVNEHLHVDVENLSVRGNEGVHMEAKRFNLTAKNSIDLRTSEDGRIHINGERVHFGSNWLSLPVSSSPALTASIDAFRICICVAVRPKLFLVMGNKPCVAPPSLCT